MQAFMHRVATAQVSSSLGSCFVTMQEQKPQKQGSNNDPDLLDPGQNWNFEKSAKF